MSDLARHKQKLAAVSRLWAKANYDAALSEVESLLASWPGNSHLHVLWAGLVQLQEDPQHDLDEARQALKRATELEPDSPVAAVELARFLDNVEDDPRGAAKVYAEAVSGARRVLIDALIGHAKALRQLGKNDEFRRCLAEILHLTRFESGAKSRKGNESGPDLLFDSLTGPYAPQVQELLGELATS